jgi:hypothetical protein
MFDARPSGDLFAGRSRFELFRDLTNAGENTLRRVDDELLAPLGLPLPERKLDANSGLLRWDNGRYYCEAVSALGGNVFTATRLPNDPTVVFVFDTSGRYVGVGTRVEELEDSQKARSVTQRKRRERAVDEEMKAAQRLLQDSSWARAIVPAAHAAPDTAEPAPADAAAPNRRPAPSRRRRAVAADAGRKPAAVTDVNDPYDATAAHTTSAPDQPGSEDRDSTPVTRDRGAANTRTGTRKTAAKATATQRAARTTSAPLPAALEAVLKRQGVAG